jgi:hypothetical protein
MKRRFRLDLTDVGADHHVNSLINKSMTAVMPQVMEMAHKMRVKMR